MSEHRVTGSLIVVKRQTGPVYYMKCRDRDGRQIKLRLGPVADWPRKAAQDALRDLLTDLGRTPGRVGTPASRSRPQRPPGWTTSSMSASARRAPCATIATP